MSRDEQIEQKAIQLIKTNENMHLDIYHLITMAKWADENPQNTIFIERHELPPFIQERIEKIEQVLNLYEDAFEEHNSAMTESEIERAHTNMKRVFAEGRKILGEANEVEGK